MKRDHLVLTAGAIALIGCALCAIAQNPQSSGKKGPENLPWTRFHPAAPPYPLTDTERQQIQSRMDQLGGAIRDLGSRHIEDALLADVEIYYEAARWKMTYPEEFFRQR